MSRGLGRIERAILGRFKRGLDSPAIRRTDDGRIASWADLLALTIYRRDYEWEDIDDEVEYERAISRRERAEKVAVLRAMHSIARKFPQRFELRGGKGRSPLWLVRKPKRRAKARMQATDAEIEEALADIRATLGE